MWTALLELAAFPTSAWLLWRAVDWCYRRGLATGVPDAAVDAGLPRPDETLMQDDAQPPAIGTIMGV